MILAQKEEALFGGAGGPEPAEDNRSAAERVNNSK